MSIFFPSDLTSASLVRFFVLVGFGVVYGLLEYQGRFRLSYSKFNQGGAIPSRIGMLVIYALPMFFYLLCYVATAGERHLYHQLVLAAVVGHFLKRCLETLFLHRYSGHLSLRSLVSIVLGYCAIVGTIHLAVNLRTPASLVQQHSVLFSSALGAVVFLLGELGNLYHHVLLARLRGPADKSYQIPQGGLFRLVACPHYFFEIVAWVGIAIMSKQLMVFGVISFSVFYLLARSVSTVRWYKAKFADYPSERKAIIPYVF